MNMAFDDYTEILHVLNVDVEDAIHCVTQRRPPTLRSFKTLAN